MALQKSGDHIQDFIVWNSEVNLGSYLIGNMGYCETIRIGCLVSDLQKQGMEFAFFG